MSRVQTFAPHWAGVFNLKSVNMKQLTFFMMAFMPVSIFASTGEVDAYGCHIDLGTGAYHCHRDDRIVAGKSELILLGASFKTDHWLYDDGPANNFGGFAINAEFVLDDFSIRTGYSLETHLSGTTGFTLNGWDFGVKYGRNLSHLGEHFYGELGYFRQNFSHADSATETLLSGYQIGVGTMAVRPNFVFDAKILYKNPNSIERMWSNLDSSFSANMVNFSGQIGVYYSF